MAFTTVAVSQPILYATVTKCVIHGTYGPEFPNTPCMVKEKCSKHYPKDFCGETVEMEYCEMLFQLETEHSDKELYQIIAQSRPVQMISYYLWIGNAQ